MKVQQTLGIIAAGIIMLAIGFAAGNAWTERRLTAERPATPIILTVPTEDIATRTSEVPGSDVPGLPRYPGAERVEYRQALDGDLIETEVEYVVGAELAVVHDFYRTVFEEEAWMVADMGVYQGEWTFFVVKNGREALVEIESRGPLIEIEIEIDEPIVAFGNFSTTD